VPSSAARRGGLIGALTSSGVPEADAEVYAEGVRRGGTLVTARVDENRYAQAEEELAKIASVRTFGHAPGKGALVTFDIAGIHAQDVSTLLDRFGIAVRVGNHCAQPLMERLGVTATARASFALYNTHEDVEALAKGIRTVLEFFR
jgi:selenocysteine lyase/cysteine desulfurase